MRNLLVFVCLAACGQPAAVDFTTAAQTKDPSDPGGGGKLPPPPPGQIGTVSALLVEGLLRNELNGIDIHLTSHDDDIYRPHIAYDERDTVCDRTEDQLAQCRTGCEKLSGLSAIATCLDACSQLGCTENVCVEKYTASYIQFPTSLKNNSIPGASQPANCTADTCPACATPTRIATLRDQHLPIPEFSVDVGYDYAICGLNWLRFLFSFDTVGFAIDTYGMHFTLHGETTHPTVYCDVIPDIDLGPLVRIDLEPAAKSGKLYLRAQASFVGSISGASTLGSVIIDPLSKWIRDAINAQLTSQIGSLTAPLGPGFDAAMRRFLGVTSHAYFYSAGTDSNSLIFHFDP